MRFMRHGVEGYHDPRNLVNPCLRGGSFKQTSVKHIVECPMAPFIYSIALRVIGRSEDLLDHQGAQQLSLDIADEFPAAVGEEPTRSAEVWYHMAHEGFTDRVRGVIAGGNENGIF